MENIMTKMITAAVLVSASALTALPATAMSIADLACGATICLSGDGGGACSPYEDKYYSIKIAGKYGTDWGATKRARKQFLKKCKTVSAPKIDMAQTKADQQR